MQQNPGTSNSRLFEAILVVLAQHRLHGSTQRAADAFQEGALADIAAGRMKLSTLTLTTFLAKLRHDRKCREVLLCVDELAARVGRLNLDPFERAKVLTGVLDVDPDLYVAISAYGCGIVGDVASASRRPLLYMPLPVLAPFATITGRVEDLPPMIRPLLDVTKAKTVKTEDRWRRGTLSKLLHSSAGHPRALGLLFKGLANVQDETQLRKVRRAH